MPSIKRRIRINLSTHFYVRLSHTILPLNEHLERYYYPQFSRDENQSSTQKKHHRELKKQFFQAWVQALNDSPEGKDYFEKWESPQLGNPKDKWRKNVGNESHFKNPVVPSYIKSKKNRIVTGRIKEEQLRGIHRYVADFCEQHGLKIENITAYAWFFDWNSGGLDLDAEVRVKEADGFERLRELSYHLLDAFRELRQGRQLVNRIGKMFYETCHALFKEPELARDSPIPEDGKFAKRYYDITKNLILECAPADENASSSAAIEMDEERLKRILGEYVSDFPGESNFLTNPAKYFVLLASGFNGNAVLLQETLHHDSELARIRLTWLWKLAIFYIAGLSKLHQRLTDHSCEFVRLSGMNQLRGHSIVEGFPDFKVRKISYIHELKLSVRADHSFDIQVFEMIWRNMKGANLEAMVHHQLNELSAYVKSKQQNFQVEYERKIEEQNREKLEKQYLEEQRQKEETEEQQKRDKKSQRKFNLFAGYISIVATLGTIFQIKYGDEGTVWLSIWKNLWVDVFIILGAFVVPVLIIVLTAGSWGRRRNRKKVTPSSASQSPPAAS